MLGLPPQEVIMSIARRDFRAAAWTVFGPLWCLAGLLFTGVAIAQSQPSTVEAAVEAQARVLSQANAAVVGVRAIAVEDATSIKTLGPVRQGSGVVIGSDGLVLTIGYLILEAENVELHLAGARMIPARVVAYDVATGFGLVQALAPLPLPPVRMGSAAALSSDEPLMISSGGDDGEVSIARMVSRRPFSGYWEYHIDGALFTSPPRTDHSGAALFNGRGELMGIGSLIVMNAMGDNHPRVPGNMFVPVDLLKPILDELRERGSSSSSHRAWMGVNCVEFKGQVRVTRISEDGPADLAGLLPGDHIMRIDGADVSGLEMLWKALWRGDKAEREVTLDVRRGDMSKTFKVQAVDRMKTLRRAKGI
jgi:serine protease Do